MKSIYVIIASLLGCVISSHGYVQGGDGRIIGGSEVPAGEMPYMVAVYMEVSDVNFQCGGALISPYLVITAGNCIDGWYAERFTVRWSSNHNLESPSGDQMIVQVAEHNLFEYFHFEVGSNIAVHDIAILRLETPIELEEYLPLPDQNDEPAVGTTCTIAGWGSTVDGGDSSSVLQAADVEIQPTAACDAAYTTRMKDIMLCAGYPEGGNDACSGDIGGPMICNGVLSGIISWGNIICGEPEKYGVYASVALYRDWIEKHNYVPGYPSA